MVEIQELKRGVKNLWLLPAITVQLRYKGRDGNAQKFAQEMLDSGTVAAITAQPGNLRYEYYVALEDPEIVLLVDSWENEAAIDAHHASPMMATIAQLREKYDLHMTVERYRSIEGADLGREFIRE